MTLLGDFLETLLSPVEPYSTLRASVTQWCNHDLADNAYGGSRSAMGRRKPRANTGSRIEENTHSIWIGGPGRIRNQRERRRGDAIENTLTVANGPNWWVRDNEGHVETASANGRSSPSLCDVDMHFDRIRLREILQSLTIEGSEIVRTAGHDCLRIRAALLAGARLWPHWLPSGADEYEFHAEPRRGVLLSIISRCNGVVFETSEVRQVAFDEQLDDGLFWYTPAAGEQVRSADVIVEHLSLRASIARVPFTVLVPAGAVEHGLDFETMYQPARMKSCPEHLVMFCRGGDKWQHTWFTQAATPQLNSENLEWEQIARNGKTMRLSDPESEGMRILEFEQQGTHVRIHSEMNRDTLLEFASSFVPAASQSI